MSLSQRIDRSSGHQKHPTVDPRTSPDQYTPPPRRPLDKNNGQMAPSRINYATPASVAIRTSSRHTCRGLRGESTPRRAAGPSKCHENKPAQKVATISHPTTVHDSVPNTKLHRSGTMCERPITTCKVLHPPPPSRGQYQSMPFLVSDTRHYD